MLRLRKLCFLKLRRKKLSQKIFLVFFFFSYTTLPHTLQNIIFTIVFSTTWCFSQYKIIPHFRHFVKTENICQMLVKSIKKALYLYINILSYLYFLFNIFLSNLCSICQKGNLKFSIFSTFYSTLFYTLIIFLLHKKSSNLVELILL